MNILIYEYILGEVITKKNAFLLNEAKIIISEKINNLSNKYADSKTSILINKENQKLIKEGNIIYRDDNLNVNSEILNLFAVVLKPSFLIDAIILFIFSSNYILSFA